MASYPRPEELGCAAQQFFETRATDDQFAVLVVSLSGNTGGQFTRKLANAIRQVTGIYVLETCATAPSGRAGTATHLEEDATSRVLQLLYRHNADMAVWGQIHPETQTYTVRYLNSLGDARPANERGALVEETFTAATIDVALNDGGRFALEVFKHLGTLGLAAPADRQNAKVLLRLSRKVAGLSNSLNQFWHGKSSFTENALLALEGDLQARYVSAAHDKVAAEQALSLLDRAFKRQEIDPMVPAEPGFVDETNFWRIAYHRALEVAAKEAKSTFAADRWVDLTRRELESETQPPFDGSRVSWEALFHRAAFGSALTQRWRLTGDKKDLNDGVRYLRESLNLAKKDGRLEHHDTAKDPKHERSYIEDLDAYRDLAELVRTRTISSIW